MTLDAVAPAPASDLTDLYERADALALRFAETAAEHDRTAVFPFANFEALREVGLLNLTVPRRFGGQGAGVGAMARVLGSLAQGEPSTALVLGWHYLNHGRLAHGRSWPEHIHEQLCRESVAGIALINPLRVEPELGTPHRGGLPATIARRTSGGWRVTGHKIYATGSPLLRYFIVWARTEDDPPRVGNVLIPREAPNWRIVETWDHLGMRATGSHDVLFEGTPIPSDYAVDLRPPAGWNAPDPVTAAWSAAMLCAVYNGIAVAARDWLVGYLHERVPSNLGAALATLPRFQTALGEIEALLFTNERLLIDLCAEVDGGGPGERATLVKHIVTTNAIRSVDIGLALIGNPGLSRHNPLERHHRDVLCSRIHSPQDDSILLGAGKKRLGIR